MRRREFIALLGGLVAAWPPATQAQKAAIPVIGFLSSASAPQFGHLVAAFRSGLNEAGFVEGQNVLIEYRWADGDYNRLPTLAAELVNQPVTALAATGGSAVAAKAVSSTVPIVFTVGDDPVKHGLVASLSRPGGNATGVVILVADLSSKRLELLHELVPTVTSVAVLANPNNPSMEAQSKGLEQAARITGLRLHFLNASDDQELDAAFTNIRQLGVDALLVGADPFLHSRRKHLVELAARSTIPAIYEWREFVEAGGLMSYGPSITDLYRQAGIYMGRILKGAKPADLPVLQPTKFEFVINLKTAKALGLQVPTTLLAQADQVIE
jgi:putative tryptophan/tyrosine transport system substrate-binding protein